MQTTRNVICFIIRCFPRRPEQCQSIKSFVSILISSLSTVSRSRHTRARSPAEHGNLINRCRSFRFLSAWNRFVTNDRWWSILKDANSISQQYKVLLIDIPKLMDRVRQNKKEFATIARVDRLLELQVIPDLETCEMLLPIFFIYPLTIYLSQDTHTRFQT